MVPPQTSLSTPLLGSTSVLNLLLIHETLPAQAPKKALTFRKCGKDGDKKPLF
jgi:hypothetical protein